jgi:hypothetical protein
VQLRIQTYVVRNGHEPAQGQYYFADPYDLIRFVKLVKQDGLYVHPHIGPYVHTEWNLDTGYGDALQSCCYAILLRCSMDCLY